MDEWKSKMKGIIDCHVHMGSMADEASMMKIRDATGIEKIALVSIQNPTAGAGLPQSFYMKAQHPTLFFVFAGLDIVNVLQKESQEDSKKASYGNR